MADLMTIVEKNNSLPNVTANFDALREEGTAYIGRLGHKLWTDFNSHDPGITMLEALVYAINDLGFRTDLPIQDLLTPEDPKDDTKQFFSAAEILTCCPVTALDYRKIIIDVEGVKNAWMFRAGKGNQNFYTEYYSDITETDLTNFSGAINRILVNTSREERSTLHTKQDFLAFIQPYISEVFNQYEECRTQQLFEVLARRKNRYTLYCRTEEELTVLAFLFSLLGNYTVSPGVFSPRPNLDEIYTALQGSVTDGGLEEDYGMVDCLVSLCFKQRLLFCEPDEVQAGYEKKILGGLYQICLELENDINPENPLEVQRIKDAVLERLCQYRNLAEDFLSIDVVGQKSICIKADIVIADEADPNEVQAQILYKVQQFLSSCPQFYSLEEMLDKGKNCEEIFQGTILENGFLDNDELEQIKLRRVLYKSDILREIMDVEGVVAVNKMNLELCNLPDEESTQIPDAYINEWCLDICQKEQSLADAGGDPYSQNIVCKHKPVLHIKGTQFTLKRNGIQTPTSQREVEEKLLLITHINEKPLFFDELDHPVPKGSYRDLNQYFSIQEDFPLVYRVGKDQVPNSFTPKHKALVKQLKGFLTFFDQILANYLAQLGSVKDILSVCQEPQDRVLFAKSIKGLDPGIDALFLDFYQINNSVLQALSSELEPADLQSLDALVGLDFDETYFEERLRGLFAIPNSTAEERAEMEAKINSIKAAALVEEYYQERLDQILENPIQHRNRRNKVLDHLIARFGEKFTDYALSLYQSCSKDACKTNALKVKDTLLECKTDFLKSIPKIGRERGKGFNYKGEDCIKKEMFWNSGNVSGLKNRVSKLLCLKNGDRVQLSCEPQFEVVKNINEQDRCFRWAVVEKGQNPSNPDTVVFLNGMKDYSLRAKAKKDYEKIRMGLLDSQALTNTDMVLEVFSEVTGTAPFYVQLKSSKSEEVIAQSQTFNVFSDAELNYETLLNLLFPSDCPNEGFHVVEHILLRPFSKDIKSLNQIQLDNKCATNCPYSFWVTIVASENWGRCKDDNGSRAFFEQLIRKETPAHIGIRFLWLSGKEMYHFEFTYKNWLYDLARQFSDDCQLEESLNNFIDVLNLLSEAKKT